MSTKIDLGEALGAATVYDLGQPLYDGMPVSASHPGFRVVLHRRHGDVVRTDGGSAAADLLVMATHCGTHIDALAHVSADGMLHGGVDAAQAQSGGSFSTHGIETMEPLVGPGVLLDVATALGVDVLEGGHPIDDQQLEAAERLAGVTVQAGDVVLVRTGWARNYTQGEAFIGFDTGVPGVATSGAGWLADRGVRATGSDTLAYERIAPGEGHRLLPVHGILLVEHGIPIIEMLDLERLSTERVYRFGFVLSPLRLVGATGSPVRPLALVGRQPG
jgi:kynurenine formamidase